MIELRFFFKFCRTALYSRINKSRGYCNKNGTNLKKKISPWVSYNKKRVNLKHSLIYLFLWLLYNREIISSFNKSEIKNCLYFIQTYIIHYNYQMKTQIKHIMNREKLTTKEILM